MASNEHRDTATPSTEAEQERALLSDWKEGEQFHHQKEHVHKNTRWRVYVLYAFAAAFLVASGFAVLAVFGKRSSPTPGQAMQDLETINTNDYILDPKFDLDASPQRREFSWTIKDHVYNPDGIYRPMILVNNQFPGPLIECNEGDTIVVHVHNQAVNATSIHWHGIYQIGTPFMDGTVGVTGCPIGPNQHFTYEFTVSGQSGTYWWHGHHGLQSSDGLHGPLVIHSKDERNLQRVPYQTDRVVLVSDHYHDLSSALLWQYLKPDMENTEPVPIGGLINGRSKRDCDQFPQRACDSTTANVGSPSIDLAPGQTHRLRLINVGAFAEFEIQLDEHQLAVTEVDGTDVEPSLYHRVKLSPAQRYSVIVNASVEDRDAFWLRAKMVMTCFTDPPKELETDVLATVRYNTLQHTIPSSSDWQGSPSLECKDMNVSDLVPAHVVAAPAEPDAFFYVRSNFEIGKYRLSRGFFNTSSFRADARSPSLHRAVDGLATANESFSAAQGAQIAFVNDNAFDISSELVIQTTGVQTIDILYSNFDDGNHPLHLHGYKFFILAQGHGHPPLTDVAAEINRTSLNPLYDTLDLANPLRRDTASVEAFGWILIRLIADNPGAWALHCHISWHSEAGLMMQMLTRTDELAKMTIPQQNLDLCAAPGLQLGMGPDDESYRELAT